MQQEAKLRGSAAWMQYFCQGCGSSEPYSVSFDTKYCRICWRHQERVSGPDCPNVLKCNNCENLIDRSSTNPYCRDCDDFYCKFIDSKDGKSCTNMSVRCLCGRSSIFDHCKEHLTEEEKNDAGVCCSVCINITCQAINCFNKVVDEYTLTGSSSSSSYPRCNHCGVEYKHSYCYLHQEFERHVHCENAVKHILDHCAWCSVKLSDEDKEKKNKCQTSKLICESFRHLHGAVEVLTSGNSNNHCVTSSFCQGCAEYCLFHTGRNKYQCINCCAGANPSSKDEEKEKEKEEKIAETKTNSVITRKLGRNFLIQLSKK
jgi:hypothetical protein